MARKKSELIGTMRHDFDPMMVLCKLENNALTPEETVRILGEACHRIARYERDLRNINAWASAITQDCTRHFLNSHIK